MSEKGKRSAAEAPESAPPTKRVKAEIRCDLCESVLQPNDYTSAYCCTKNCLHAICGPCIDQSTDDALLDADWGYDAVSSYCCECFRRLKKADENVRAAFMTAAKHGIDLIFFQLCSAVPRATLEEGARTAVWHGHQKLITDDRFLANNLPIEVYEEVTKAIVLSDEETTKDD